jgi:beta-mannanase
MAVSSDDAPRARDTSGLPPARTGPEPTVLPATTSSQVRRENELVLGVATRSGPKANKELDDFERTAGQAVRIVTYYDAWSNAKDFDREGAESVTARGAVPLVTWEPWNPRNGLDQPDYRLRRIATGAFDDYITRWANGAKAWGGRVLLRFGHEMNGDWYPWTERTNGNGPGDYVAAWRHVHDLFDQVGATNVEWVWSPNVAYAGSTSLDELYPGDDRTDWVALDGYNFGTTSPKHGWESFEHIFASSIDDVRRIAPDKPLLIAEVGCTEEGGNKAAWITDMFERLARRPEVVGIVWFNIDKQTDWRVTSSRAAAAAFANGLAAAGP